MGLGHLATRGKSGQFLEILKSLGIHPALCHLLHQDIPAPVDRQSEASALTSKENRVELGLHLA